MMNVKLSYKLQEIMHTRCLIKCLKDIDRHKCGVGKVTSLIMSRMVLMIIGLYVLGNTSEASGSQAGADARQKGKL